MKKPELRIEADELGEMEVPMHSLWGVRTARWLSRSRAGAMQYQETRLHPLMVEALATIYKAQLAVARTVHSGLDGSDAAAIQAATTLKGQVLDEILNGQLKDQLLVDLRLSPLGEAVFDNFNEVVEGRARELLGLRAHEGRQGAQIKSKPLATASGIAAARLPLTGASYFLAAVRLAANLALRDLESTLLDLERLVRRQSLTLEKSLRQMGRQSREELAPATVFSLFGNAAERNLKRLKETRNKLLELALDAPQNYQYAFALELAALTGMPFREAEQTNSPVEKEKSGDTLSRQAVMDLQQVAAMLKELSIDISHMCQVLSGLSESFTDSTVESPDRLTSHSSTLSLACLRVQAEEMQVSLALQADINRSACPAISLAAHGILSSSDALKSALKSFNQGYLSRLKLRN